jgi:hypothetical protein
MTAQTLTRKFDFCLAEIESAEYNLQETNYELFSQSLSILIEQLRDCQAIANQLKNEQDNT